LEFKGRELKAADDVVEFPAKRICSHCMQSEIGTCFLLTSFLHSLFLTVSVMFPPFSSLMESIYFFPLLKLPPMLFPCSTLRSQFLLWTAASRIFYELFIQLCAQYRPQLQVDFQVMISVIAGLKRTSILISQGSQIPLLQSGINLSPFFLWNCGACFYNMLSICSSAKWWRDNFQVEKDAGN
jgi:hypothetical protein